MTYKIMDTLWVILSPAAVERCVSFTFSSVSCQLLFSSAGKPVQMRQQQRTTFPLAVAVYIAHWGFLAAFAMVGMHVQVATRLLSTCPPLYWFAAQLCYRRRRYAQLIWLYFLGYAALGYVLFPQFLPWT
jgi:Mannosyltransferase (PIG-V)